MHSLHIARAAMPFRPQKFRIFQICCHFLIPCRRSFRARNCYPGSRYPEYPGTRVPVSVTPGGTIQSSDRNS
eukprot:599475-Rhodomonas_salina.1